MTTARVESRADRPADETGPLAATAAVDTTASGVDAERDEISRPPGFAPELRHERFRIGEKLGEGGMGVVYRARDGRDGREVALKLMKGTLAGTARHRFEREFRSLSALRHPHCLDVYDYGELGGGPFFTMELFQGRPITTLAGRGLREVLEPLLQLTHALDYIHGHGIIHRDVKPSNVLVRPATREDGTPYFESRLMDFGLAKYYGVKSSLSAEAGFVGTVAYCAPEQLNLDELDHRADLYCLGLVAYEVLSGRYAFPEARLAGMRPLMQAQLNEKPRPIGEVNPEVPAPVADAVMKYLRKQPRRRPDSAGLLRSAIAGHLGVDAPILLSGVSIPSSRPALAFTGFVCRASEQEILGDVVRRCLRPGPDGEALAPVILVGGEPGIGKSSVVQETGRIARGHGCQVYEGRCFDGNLSPFQPFVEILRQLLAELRLQERREGTGAAEDLTGTHVAGLPAESLVRLLGIVGDYRGELLRVAPELRRYLPGEAYQQVDYGREADYIYRALAAFFLEFATFQPVCLSFEDLQWADRSSLDLLRHLASALSAARRAADAASVPRLVIVASARTGYPALEALMEQLRERRHALELLLSPLAEEETRELIALRLNCRPDELGGELVSRVHALCGGNPFFVAETVREWHDKQAIAREEGSWVLRTEAADSTDLPETVRDVMRLRIQGLTPQAQQVLNAAAVIGAIVDIDLLSEVLPDLSESEVLDAIDQLIPRRVLRETGNAARVEFVHDLLRELPYAELSASRRRSLHRRVAEVLEQQRARGRPVAPSALAEHFEQGGEPSRGFIYTLEAAEAALDAYASYHAVGLLRKAREILPHDADEATRYRLWDKLGKALDASGRLDEAIEAYTHSLAHAAGRGERAAALYGIGRIWHRKGDYPEQQRWIDKALGELGTPLPHGVLGYVIGYWLAFLEFHFVPSWVHVRRRGPAIQRETEVAISAYLRLCYAPRSVLTYSYNAYRIAILTKRSGTPELSAVGYSKIYLTWGWFSLGRFMERYRSVAEKSAESCRRPEVKAVARAHIGVVRYCDGRLREAEADMLESVAVLDKAGDWFGIFTHHNLRHLYAVRGDLARELAEAEIEIASGIALGDPEILAYGQYGKASVLAKSGRTDEAIALIGPAVESLAARSSLALLIAYGHLGFVRLQASDYAGAREALLKSRGLTVRTYCAFEYAGPTFPLLVESLLGPRWAVGESQGGPSRPVARQANREARVARFVGSRYPNYGPHALRVSGRAAFSLGKAEKAAKYLERSIVAAEKLGARYDLARALLDASRVIPEKAEDYRRRGQALLNELGAVVPEAERLPRKD